MFEQSLYETEPVATPLAEGDLFHNYEIKNWEFSPRLYKILGIAAVGNILAILIVAQTSLLTLKGCDSPFVGRVCEVLDTVYVGSLLFGTDRQYVDAAYDKTDLGDADITFVDVSGETPPLSYPEGYFAVANPIEYQAMLDQLNNPQFPPSMTGFPPGVSISPPVYGNSLIDTKPNIPKANPNVIDGNLPSIDDRTGLPDPPKARRNGFGGGRRVIAPRATPDISKPPVDPNANVAVVKKDPDKKADPTDPVSENDINKRPFKDLANIVNDLVSRKEINLENSQFLVEATGKLNKDGKLEKKTFRFTRAVSNDPKMVDVVKKSIEAFNDSGFLKYLKDLSGKDINLSIKQDQTVIAATVQSELDRDTLASSVASALKLGIGFAQDKKKKEIAQMQAENNPEKAQDLQNEIDDLALLDNTQVTSDGKKLVVTFNVQKTIVQQMIQRKLAEQAKEPRQPNGNAITKPNDNSAQK